MTTPGTSESSVSNPNSVPHRAWALVGIVLTIVLSGAILALLLYRAMAKPEPSRVLVIRGDSSWEGAVVRVEGDALPQPMSSDIQQAGSYVVPFFLWPGQYTVHVLSQGNEVYSQRVDLTDERTGEIDLLHRGATTRPATNPS